MSAKPAAQQVATDATRGDRWFAALQKCLPTRAISALMFRFAEWRNPRFRRWLIGWFLRRYPVNLAEAEFERVASYDHFNAFFTRALKPGMRPQPEDPALFTSPVDGAISQFGEIREGRIFQAKGHDYSAAELLGSAEWAQKFAGGSFCTIYLAPHDYHRVHMPFGGRLRCWTYLPGRLFSVNPSTARAVPALFARNERVVSIFDTDFGPLAQVMVGALIVGGVETVWAGRITPPHHRRIEPGFYEPIHAQNFARGAEMGRFHMGSTVVLLAPPGALRWVGGLAPAQPVRLGQPLAAVTNLPSPSLSSPTP